jgi:hypothetical protein
MKTIIRESLEHELRSRGFTSNGVSPNETMVLQSDYLADVEIAELLEMMVARREKVFHSQSVVGPMLAKKSYDDVVLVIDALKKVIQRFLSET